jgi:hypothetical protein
MAKLTTRKRKSLPKKDFGLPGKKAYPMPDKEHARLAKSGASRAERIGNITSAQKKKIDAKANRILKKTPASKKKG